MIPYDYLDLLDSEKPKLYFSRINAVKNTFLGCNWKKKIVNFKANTRLVKRDDCAQISPIS
jgi:hypothetical protein